MKSTRLDGNTRAAARFLIGVLIALAGSACAVADEHPFAAARAEFRRAYEPLETGRPSPVENDSDALRAYPLYPYLQRARLIHALATPEKTWSPIDEQTRAFLELHDSEPVAADLRRAWLRSLARRMLWQTFVEHYRPIADDRTLHCQFLKARIDFGQTAGLETEVVDLWLTPAQLPSECEAPFDWLRGRGGMHEQLVEQRVRLLLENGQTTFARTIARQLPAARAAPLREWADLLDRPAESIDRLLATPHEVEDTALLSGWAKLSRNDPAAALARYRPLVDGQPRDRASRLALALALGLAWDRRPEALAVFDDVADSDLDDYALGWLARAALWAGDWTGAEQAILAMTPEQRDTSRWRYWAARAAGQRRDRGRARELYASILPDDNWYAAAAAARLGRLAEPHPESLERDADVVRALAGRTGFERALELKVSALRTAATEEWLAEYARLSEAERLQAIHLAADWEWHDVSVATASRQNVFFDYALLYPQPYADEVRRASRVAKLDPPLLYGVIRQESLFRHDAVSPAGAMGLGQLKLETARYVAREAGLPAPRAADLLDPGINVRLAALHVRDLLERFGAQLPVALAGYNAGPLAAERWLPGRPLDADVWIENIPYNETRDYVQRVLWHHVVFAWLRSGKAQDASAWLAPLQPPEISRASAR